EARNDNLFVNVRPTAALVDRVHGRLRLNHRDDRVGCPSDKASALRAQRQQSEAPRDTQAKLRSGLAAPATSGLLTLGRSCAEHSPGPSFFIYRWCAARRMATQMDVRISRDGGLI